jgi:hypothetical protein
MTQQAHVQADSTEDERAKERILIAARSYDRMTDLADERVNEALGLTERLKVQEAG